MNMMPKLYTVFVFCGLLAIQDAQENNVKSDGQANETKIEEMLTSVVDSPSVIAKYVSPELQEKYSPGKSGGEIGNYEKSEGNSEIPFDSAPTNPSDEPTENRAESPSGTSTQKYTSALSTQDTTTEEKSESESQQNLTNTITSTGSSQNDTKEDSQSDSQQRIDWQSGKPFFTSYLDYYQHYYEYPTQYSVNPSKPSMSNLQIDNRAGDSTENDVPSKGFENGGSNRDNKNNAPTTVLTLPNQILLQTEDGDYIIIIPQEPIWGSNDQYPGNQAQYPGVPQQPTASSDSNADDSVVINAPGYVRYVYQYIVPPRIKYTRNLGKDVLRVISAYEF